ncbi:MAG: hypothetical protein ND807_18005 [Vicinamibacterales bacterium]|nr:hypothetical protein [Vicinamibacterales bacterium]
MLLLRFDRVDLIARVAEIPGNLIRVRIQLLQLLGLEIALDFEAPQVGQQRAFLRGQLSRLSLQRLQALARTARLTFGPRALGLRERRCCEGYDQAGSSR